MRTTPIISLLVPLAVAGCGGGSISPELRTARDTIDRARSGQAARLEADRLRRAERILLRAEAAPDGSHVERDLAYIADRHARMAMAGASLAETQVAMEEEARQYQSELERTAIDRDRRIAAQESHIARMQRELASVQGQLGQVRAELDRNGRTLDERTRQLHERERELAMREEQLVIVVDAGRGAASELRETRAELASVRRELGEVRTRLDQRSATLDEATRELEARERELAMRERQLEVAMQARAEADDRARDAMRQLEELAMVRQAEDEIVVTLSGEVLFEYDQAELRPIGRQRLRAVADALEAQPDAHVVIEGYTDSRGNDPHNVQLSQRRAEAVRQFLIDEGVDMSRLRAVGRGEESPVASNDTPEGRANNRRVELHLRPVETGLASTQMQASDERVSAATPAGVARD